MIEAGWAIDGPKKICKEELETGEPGFLQSRLMIYLISSFVSNTDKVQNDSRIISLMVEDL